MFEVIVGLIVFLVAVWWLYFNNMFSVEPNNRERLVVENGLTGEMDVLGPGTWFKPVWWKEFKRVKLNREPINVENEEVRSSEGTLLLVSCRYDIVSGREFDPKTGKLKHALDNMNAITPDVVKLAVTQIDYEDRTKRVASIVSAAIEDMLGYYTPNQLTSPAVDSPEVPLGSGVKIKTAAELYKKLEAMVQAEADQKLTFVGINIVDFEITGIKAKDTALQSEIERSARTQKRTEAAKKVMDAAKTEGSELSYREALVVGDEDFGKVAASQAARDVSENLSKAIVDGMRNFGKGPKP